MFARFNQYLFNSMLNGVPEIMSERSIITSKKKYKNTGSKQHRPEDVISYSRWLYIISVAERLEEIRCDGHNGHNSVHEEILEYFNSLAEVFSKNIDPFSDLEGYAVRRLFQEIINLLKIQVNIKINHF